MDYLVDTSILVRSVHQEDPASRTARRALLHLTEAGHRLCITPQNAAEFWVVCTRPKGGKSNGLGYPTVRVQRYISRFERLFTMLFETADVYVEWKYLVTTHAVRGLEAHDTRLVAAMLAHGIENILTFNDSDFTRYPRIKVAHPAAIAGS